VTFSRFSIRTFHVKHTRGTFFYTPTIPRYKGSLAVSRETAFRFNPHQHMVSPVSCMRNYFFSSLPMSFGKAIPSYKRAIILRGTLNNLVVEQSILQTTMSNIAFCRASLLILVGFSTFLFWIIQNRKKLHSTSPNAVFRDNVSLYRNRFV